MSYDVRNGIFKALSIKYSKCTYTNTHTINISYPYRQFSFVVELSENVYRKKNNFTINFKLYIIMWVVRRLIETICIDNCPKYEKRANNDDENGAHSMITDDDDEERKKKFATLRVLKRKSKSLYLCTNTDLIDIQTSYRIPSLCL